MSDSYLQLRDLRFALYEHLQVQDDGGLDQDTFDQFLDAGETFVTEFLSPDDIDDAAISGALDTAGVPDPDLVIRTSGEQRVSNFLLWQAAYSEYEFVPTLWPDFTPEMFAKILDKFGTRERRFGAAVG